MRSTDGKRRITPIAQILGYASRPSNGQQVFQTGNWIERVRVGYVGPATLQAVVSELH